MDVNASELTGKLKQLRLSGVLDTLTTRERQAIYGKWSYLAFLEQLLEDEVERRAQKQLALRLRRVAVGSTKTLEGFDWQCNGSINRQQVLQLASGTYLRERRNVLIFGPSGGWERVIWRRRWRTRRAGRGMTCCS